MAPHQRMSLGDNIECESPGAKRPYRGRRCANKFAAGKTAKWARARKSNPAWESPAQW